MKSWRQFGQPYDKSLKSWVGSERCDCVVIARQFSFGKRDMNFVVTNLMKKNGRSRLAPFQFGDKVMKTLPGICRNGPITQGTYRIRHGFHSGYKATPRASLMRVIEMSKQADCA